MRHYLRHYLYLAAVTAAAIYHAAVGSMLLALAAALGIVLYPVARWYSARAERTFVGSARSHPSPTLPSSR